MFKLEPVKFYLQNLRNLYVDRKENVFRKAINAGKEAGRNFSGNPEDILNPAILINEAIPVISEFISGNIKDIMEFEAKDLNNRLMLYVHFTKLKTYFEEVGSRQFVILSENNLEPEIIQETMENVSGVISPSGLKLILFDAGQKSEELFKEIDLDKLSKVLDELSPDDKDLLLLLLEKTCLELQLGSYEVDIAKGQEVDKSLLKKLKSSVGYTTYESQRLLNAPIHIELQNASRRLEEIEKIYTVENN